MGSSKSNNGQMLLQLMMASVILAIIGVGVQKLMSSGFKNKARLHQGVDREILKLLLVTSGDCMKTFQEAGILPAAPGGQCDSTSADGGQVPPYMRMRRRTTDGSTQYLTGPLEADGGATIGNQRVRVSCSESEQTLIIRIAEPGSSDFYGRQALLFGAPPNAFPICFLPMLAPPP